MSWNFTERPTEKYPSAASSTEGSYIDNKLTTTENTDDHSKHEDILFWVYCGLGGVFVCIVLYLVMKRVCRSEKKYKTVSVHDTDNNTDNENKHANGDGENKEKYIINDPLIVILGIGKYVYNNKTKLKNLEGVSKDYENIINVFTKYWNFYVCYKNDKNELVYTNKYNKHHSNKYKLSWTTNEIVNFCNQAKGIAISYKKRDGDNGTQVNHKILYYSSTHTK